MARKMYYTEQEAADLLGVTLDGLAKYVQDQRLQVFKDGNKNMYKGDEVETLASDTGAGAAAKGGVRPGCGCETGSEPLGALVVIGLIGLIRRTNRSAESPSPRPCRHLASPVRQPGWCTSGGCAATPRGELRSTARAAGRTGIAWARGR